MQNRKKVNQEIERKIKGRRRLSAIITCIAIAAVVVAILWVVWDVRSRSWIVEFEGNRIAVSDMQFHATRASHAAGMQVHPNDPAMQDFLVQHIIDAEVLMQRAEAAGLGLTSAEREEMLDFARENRENWAPSVPVARLAELFGLFEFSVSRLMERYGHYELDPAELEQEFADFMAEHGADMELRSTEAQLIFSDDREALEAIKEEAAAIIDATEFEAFAREVCLAYAEQEFVFADSILGIIEMLGLIDYTAELIELQEGEMSSIIEIMEGEYVLIFMESRPGIDEAEIKDWLEQQIVMERSSEMFIELMDGWRADANYSINSRALAH